MYAPYIRRAFLFLAPGGVLFLAMVYAASHEASANWLDGSAKLYAYAIAIVALALGWRFDRSRLVYATAVLAAGAWLMHWSVYRFDAISWVTQATVEILLPFNLALFALTKERGIFTPHGLLRWAVIAAQPIVVWVLLRNYGADFFAPLVTKAQQFPGQFYPLLRTAQPAMWIFVLALGVIVYRCVRRPQAMEYGLFWALALVAYGLMRSPTPGLTTAYFATAILILVTAVIESSYTMAFHDELTGLPARRALNETLQKLGSRYTVAMLDVDHFKGFNDTYGHDVGDQVLKMVATCMERVRGGGKVFRYGGEEFTVVFAGKSVEETVPFLEALREDIAASGFTVRGPNRPKEKGDEPVKGSDEVVSITVSIGVAERQGGQTDPHEVIKAADRALYVAKKAGRNRVVTA